MTATQHVPAQPATVEPGQRWTFVDSTGERTEYVVGDPRDDAFMTEKIRNQFWAKREPQDHPHNIVYLLNEKTGKYAMVTRYWLRGGGGRNLGQCFWLPPENNA